MIIAAKGAVSAASSAALPYRWVIVGSNGELKTSDSTTANSWTTRTSSFGTTGIENVASNGLDLYVAVGKSGKLATSNDGITWTQQTSGFGTTEINAIAYGGDGYWVATGQNGKLATSLDGITWTQQTSGTTQTLWSVAWGANTWVTGGGGGVMRTASNPTGTWTGRTSTLTNIYWNRIYYAPDQAIWVAGNDTGTTGALASSTDGLTWTARNSAFSMAQLFGAFQSNSSVIVCGNTTNDGSAVCDVQSSTNGTTWTDRTPADGTEYIQASASDESGFIIMAGTKIQSTTDGTTWTDRGSPSMLGLIGCCHSSGLPAIR